MAPIALVKGSFFLFGWDDSLTGHRLSRIMEKYEADGEAEVEALRIEGGRTVCLRTESASAIQTHLADRIFERWSERTEAEIVRWGQIIPCGMLQSGTYQAFRVKRWYLAPAFPCS